MISQKDILVSTVIPVYSTTYLQEAVDSVCKQSHENQEIIIVNDNPALKNAAIFDVLSGRDKRISIYHNPENVGSAYTRNIGISLSKGKYIAFIDADDVWSDIYKIQKQMQVVERNPDIQCVGTNYKFIDSTGEVLKALTMPRDNSSIRENMNYIMPMLQSSRLVGSEVLKKTHGYNNKYIVAQDHDLLMRMGKYTHFYNIEDFCTLYRWHGENISIKKSHQQNYQAILNIIHNGHMYPGYKKAILLALSHFIGQCIKPHISPQLFDFITLIKKKTISLPNESTPTSHHTSYQDVPLQP